MKKHLAVIVVSMLSLSTLGMYWVSFPSVAEEPDPHPEIEEPPVPDSPTPLLPNSTQPDLPEGYPPDNVTSFSHNVTTPELIEVPFPLPDLEIVEMETSYNYTWEGTIVVITAHVYNAGSYMVNETNVSFYDNEITGNALISTEPCVFEGFTTEVSANWTSTDQSIHQIIAVVDEGDTFEESNESNNEGQIPVKVAPPLEEIPDVSVASDDIAAWDLPEENASTSIDITVHNYGNGIAHDVDVVVRDILTGMIVDNYTIPSISPYSSNLTTVEWISSFGGENRVYAIVDPYSTIEELRETNNYAEAGFHVSAEGTSQGGRGSGLGSFLEPLSCFYQVKQFFWDVIIPPGEYIVWDNCIIVLYNSNIRVFGYLTIRRTTVLMWSVHSFLPKEISVETGGWLMSEQDSLITSVVSWGAYKFIVNPFSTLTMSLTTLRWVWGDLFDEDGPGGLQIFSNMVSISSSTIQGGLTHGVYIHDDVALMSPISNNVIFDCGVAGIYVREGAIVTISGGELRNNKYGVWADSSSPTIQDVSLIEGNQRGIYVYMGSPSIHGNTFAGNIYGIGVREGSSSVITQNVILDSYEIGIYLYWVPSGFTPTISGNTAIQNNRRGVQAYRSDLQLTNEISIIGNEDGVVCIDCTGLVKDSNIQGDPSVAGHGILIYQSSDLLTIESNSIWDSECGICSMASSPKILSNDLEAIPNRGVAVWDAPFLGQGSSSLIDNENDITSAYYGIRIDSSNTRVYNSYIYTTPSSPLAMGVYLKDNYGMPEIKWNDFRKIAYSISAVGSNVDISYNTFENERWWYGGVGVYAADTPDSISISDNDFKWVTATVYLQRVRSGSGATINGNTMEHIKYDEMGEPGGRPFTDQEKNLKCFIMVYHGTKAAIFDNTFIGSVWGVSVTSQENGDNDIASDVDIWNNVFKYQGYIAVSSSGPGPPGSGDGDDNNVMDIWENTMMYSRGGAIFTYSSATVTIIDNIISHNDGYSDEFGGVWNGAIHLHGRGEYLVQGSLITQYITFTNASGIRIDNPAYAITGDISVDNNYIAYNGVGIQTSRRWDSAYDVWIRNNDIWNNNFIGINVTSTGCGAVMMDNMITGNPHGVYFHMLACTYTYDTYNDISYNNHGLSAGLIPEVLPNYRLTITSQVAGAISDNLWAIYAEESVIRVHNNEINSNGYAIWSEKSMVAIESNEMHYNQNGIIIEGSYNGYYSEITTGNVIGGSDPPTSHMMGAGIYVFDLGDPILHDNEVYGYEWGVYSYGTPLGNRFGVYNLHVHDNTHGIYFHHATISDSEVFDCLITDNTYGIVIDRSFPIIGPNRVADSSGLIDNMYAVWVEDDAYPLIQENDIEVGIVSGIGVTGAKGIYAVDSNRLFAGEPGLEIVDNAITRTGGTASGVELIQSIGNVDSNEFTNTDWAVYSNTLPSPPYSPGGKTVVNGNTMTATSYGVRLIGEHWIDITENSISGEVSVGIVSDARPKTSDSIRIIDNVITGTSQGGTSLGGYGVIIKYGGIVQNNRIWNFWYGMEIGYYVVFEYNLVDHNNVGVLILNSAHDSVARYNCIEHNSKIGAESRPLGGSPNMDFYYNNFVDNGRIPSGSQANDHYNSRWDDDVSVGNYWSDYVPPGPYDVPPNGQDRYPQTTPFGMSCGP